MLDYSIKKLYEAKLGQQEHCKLCKDGSQMPAAEFKNQDSKVGGYIART